MKLIKINKLIAVIICFTSLQINASEADGVLENNLAAKLLGLALKSAKKENKKPELMDKLLGKFIGKKEKPEETEVKDKAEPEKKDFKSGEFTDGQSKEEKEKNEIDQEIVYEAYLQSLEATLLKSESPEVRMNLGLSFELSGDLDNAYKAYHMADKFGMNSKQFQFIAKYNKARLLAAQEKTDEAIAMYQKALDINPESKEIKVNIELLLQQQQGGGGGGEGDKDQEGDEEGDKQNPNAPMKKPPKNSEYKSKNLSKKNVEKILEELKNQEQKIREKEYNKGVKEKPRDKDW